MISAIATATAQLPAPTSSAARALEPVGVQVEALGTAPDQMDRVRAYVGAAGVLTLGAILVQATFLPYFTRYPVESAGVWGQGTAEAMALVRERVPPGTTVCIDTAVFSYYTFPHFIAWYLPDRRADVVERVMEEPCTRPGSYLLARAETEVPDGVEPSRG